MDITHSGIYYAILSHAPFWGTLIYAYNNSSEKRVTSLEDIIEGVKSSSIDKGIILLGGWTKQPDELRALVLSALKNDLKVYIKPLICRDLFEQEFSDILGLGIGEMWVDYRDQTIKY